MTRVDASLLRQALALLGVRRFTLAIQDPSFPADPVDDRGRGTPYSGAARRFLHFAASAGFDAVQLGPQGRTSLDNPSPYDGTLFSREPMDLALQPLVEDPSWGGLLCADRVAQLRAECPRAAQAHVDHRHAFLAAQALVPELYRAFHEKDGPALRERRRELTAYAAANAHWLEPDGLYEALAAQHGIDDWCAWPEVGASRLDCRLFAPRPGEEDAVRRRLLELRSAHAETVDAWTFTQFVLDAQHRRLREDAQAAGLRLYGDLQVGVSHRDRWSRRGLFLPDYLMGAPPSRTNPEGQAWGYPVLDPLLHHDAQGGPGPARRFVAARLDRLLGDFDGVRLDHPHGLVTPWVYRADAADPLAAVRDGARLFASPDLPDHPGLAPYAITRPDQIDRTRPRHDDLWASSVTPEQVARYAVLLDVVLAQARAHGRQTEDVLCEVLSTWPLPLRLAMEQRGLGRFCVTQKADPKNPEDVYRTSRTEPRDWVMIGSHDTPSVWSLVYSWAGREKGRDWAAYLASRLVPEEEARPAWIARVAADPGHLADALLADLFLGPAQHVCVFFADLLGLEERYNVPGSVGPHNWSLRVPPDFEKDWDARRERGAALDPARSLALALRSRPDADARSLADRLARQA
jgi:4-alpha-glucanotransferase